MKNDKDEFNFIIMKDRVHTDKEIIIIDYLEILKTCETSDEIESLLSDFYDEIVLLTGEFIIEKQMIKSAEILENLRTQNFKDEG